MFEDMNTVPSTWRFASYISVPIETLPSVKFISAPDVTHTSEPPITAEDGIPVRPEPTPEIVVTVNAPTFAVPFTSRVNPGVLVPTPTLPPL